MILKLQLSCPKLNCSKHFLIGQPWKRTTGDCTMTIFDVSQIMIRLYSTGLRICVCMIGSWYYTHGNHNQGSSHLCPQPWDPWVSGRAWTHRQGRKLGQLPLHPTAGLSQIANIGWGRELDLLFPCTGYGWCLTMTRISFQPTPHDQCQCTNNFKTPPLQLSVEAHLRICLGPRLSAVWVGLSWPRDGVELGFRIGFTSWNKTSLRTMPPSNRFILDISNTAYWHSFTIPQPLCFLLGYTLDLLALLFFARHTGGTGRLSSTAPWMGQDGW